MSTLNSTNMSVKRPTTKVRHAPGGASSINLSFDDMPVGAAAKSGFKPTFEPSPELVEPVEEQTKKPEPASPAPEPVQSEAPAVAAEPVPVQEPIATGVSIGLVYAATSTVNEALKARTVEVLQSRGVEDIKVVAVADVLQLPFAAKQMVARAKGLVSVIVLAAITEEVWASSEIAAAVANGMVQLSLEQSIPVVPGFVYAVSEKEASTKVTDLPAGWVTSALALAKFEVQTVAPKAAQPPAPVAASPVKTKEPVTPTKPVTARPPGAVDGTPTPMRSSRGRGAGPSSIVFG